MKQHKQAQESPVQHYKPHKIDAKKGFHTTNRESLYIKTIYYLQKSKFKPNTTFISSNKLFPLSSYFLSTNWVSWPLKDFKSIRHLTIDISEGKYITDASIKQRLLSLPLTSIKNLQVLTIDFSNCPLITAASLKLLFVQLKHIKSLKRLEISLKGCCMVKYDGLVYISKFIRNLNHLETLVLNCTKHDLSEPTSLFGRPLTVSLLGQKLDNSPFTLQEGLRIQDKEVALISSTIKKTKGLKGIDLNFSRTRITNKSLRTLSYVLGGQKDLGHLALSLSSCKVDDRGIFTLAKIFSELDLLKEVKLELGFCGSITSLSITDLISKISKLDSLTHFGISLYGCSLNNKSIEDFSSAIESMRSLKYLILDLGGVQGIDPAKSALKSRFKQIEYKNIREPKAINSLFDFSLL